VWSPCYTRAISERFRDKGIIIKRYINSPSLLYFTFSAVPRVCYSSLTLCVSSTQLSCVEMCPRRRFCDCVSAGTLCSSGKCPKSSSTVICINWMYPSAKTADLAFYSTSIVWNDLPYALRHTFGRRLKACLFEHWWTASGAVCGVFASLAPSSLMTYLLTWGMLFLLTVTEPDYTGTAVSRHVHA